MGDVSPKFCPNPAVFCVFCVFCVFYFKVNGFMCVIASFLSSDSQTGSGIGSTSHLLSTSVDGLQLRRHHLRRCARVGAEIVGRAGLQVGFDVEVVVFLLHAREVRIGRIAKLG